MFVLTLVLVWQVRKATVDCENRGEAASATAKAVEDLGRLRDTLKLAKDATFDACAAEASSKFYGLFRDRILQLVHNFPEVCVSVCGCLCLRVLVFDSAERLAVGWLEFDFPSSL